METLRGKRLLVVEDEPLVAMLIEDSLAGLGCTALTVATGLAEAQSEVGGTNYDLVVLDVNLNGQHAFALADGLVAKGVPFIFSTGYGANGIPSHLRQVPILQKPFQETELVAAMQAALAAKTP